MTAISNTREMLPMWILGGAQSTNLQTHLGLQMQRVEPLFQITKKYFQMTSHTNFQDV